MAIRKKSLRRMTPLAREIAKVSNELQSLKRRLITLADKVQEQEMYVRMSEMKNPAASSGVSKYNTMRICPKSVTPEHLYRGSSPGFALDSR